MFLNSLQHFIFIGILLLHAFSSVAQSIELDNVGRIGFKGIQKLDKEGYYLPYEETNANTRWVKLITLDNHLARTNEFKLALKKEDKLEDISFNAGHFIFIKSNKKEKSRTYQVVDSQGNETATKTTVETSTRSLERPAMTTPLGQTDFLVISPAKDKKEGYSIERFNDKLESQYKEIYEPEKKRLYPLDYLVSNNTLYILEYVSADLSDYFEYHVAGFNLTNGKQLFKNHLKSEDDKTFGQTSFLRQAPNNSVITGGIYLNSPAKANGVSEGLYTALIDSTGKMRYQHQSWKALEAKIKEGDISNPIWGGKTKSLIHDIVVNKDSTFTLISENFRIEGEGLQGGKNKTVGILSKTNNMSSSDTPLSYESLTVSEFVLFNFSKDNSLTGFRKLDKPGSLIVIKPTNDPDNQPNVEQERETNLANILNNKGYFPYEFTADKNEEKVLVYQFRYEKLFKEKLFFVPLNATYVNNSPIDITSSLTKAKQEVDITRTEKKTTLNSLLDIEAGIDPDIQSTYYIKGSDNPQDYRSRQSNTRIASSNLPGKILIYDFIVELTGNISQKRNMLNDYIESMSNAKLKIQYITIP